MEDTSSNAEACKGDWEPQAGGRVEISDWVLCEVFSAPELFESQGEGGGSCLLSGERGREETVAKPLR